MGKKIRGIRGINLFISSIAVCLFLTSIWLLYCFIIFKESLYAVGFMLSLSSVTAAVGINIQIFKFIPLDDVIDDKKRGKKELEKELEELLKEENKVNEKKCVRKAKRYTTKIKSFVKISYNINRNQEMEEVEILDISRNGIKISSNRRIDKKIKIELFQNEVVEGEVVREGVVESENIYYYGVKFKNSVNGKKLQEIIGNCA